MSPRLCSSFVAQLLVRASAHPEGEGVLGHSSRAERLSFNPLVPLFGLCAVSRGGRSIMKLAVASKRAKNIGGGYLPRQVNLFWYIDPCTRVQFKKARKCGKYCTSETAWQVCLNGLVGSGRAHVFQDDLAIVTLLLSLAGM